MVLTVSKTLSFVPEFNGNKELAEADRIVVHYKNPTFQMKEKIKGKSETVARADVNGKIEGIDISLKTDEVAILREMLIRIDGLSYRDEKGVEVEIKDAAQLIVAPVEFTELIDEIVKEFEKVLNKKVPEKNS